MRKDRLNELLDSIYELEGLVHLAITRDDEPAKLPELIIRKAREMSDRASLIVSDAQTEKETLTVAEAAAYEEEEDSGIDIPEEPVRQVSFDDEIVKGKAVVNVSEEPERISDKIISEKPERIPDEIISEKPERISDEGGYSYSDEPHYGFDDEIEQDDEDDILHISPDDVERIDIIEHKFNDHQEPRGRLVFSINDRYRFRRELFNNNDAAFNTTLSLVASMDGYEEAEDYFLNELQWNEASPEVIDFLEILKKYFK